MSQMVTTCANCRQQLAVTAADLRVGQGYVRCGRCDKVFNALLTLAEDAPAPTEPESVAHGTRSMPALEQGEDDLPPLPGRENEAIPFGSMDEDEVEVVQTHVTGQFRSIVLEGDAPAPTGREPQPDPDLDLDVGLELEPETPTGTADPQREEMAREIIRQATSQPIDVLLDEEPAEVRPGAPTEPRFTATDSPSAPVADDFDADAAVGNPRRASGWWSLLAVALLLGLIAQVVHHNRSRLAGVPSLAGPLQAVYGLFGRTLDPPWDLGRYEVQQLGAAETDSASLVVQAAVAVHRDARWAQPPPVLRVVLSDRFGNVLSTTDVAPGDWMLGETRQRLEPGQRVDARLTLPAPEGVSGFSLSACLPDEGGAVRCRDELQ